ncbi:transposase family protein [Peribacillus cavernae]|uniref:transposase family protein n=1 Tax=Peribacillus cavernae TaxID=1674310 RepID=UPI002783AAB6|nr:transposase family protein [Peribacillus cavernae]MDQ0221233.1 transposase [Peribacillus cavernae]
MLAVDNSLFHLDEKIEILMQTVTKDECFFILEVTSSSAKCPHCGALSQRTHSRYIRHIDDLPAQDHHIHFQLISYKWFCDRVDCPSKVFTERLPWIKPYKRKTIRLEKSLRKIAFSTNCLTAEKVCQALRIPVSHDSLLRRVKEEPAESLPSSSP